MTPTSGPSGEMDETLRFLRMRDPLQLDDGTVDRLLGGMLVDDAPPSYRRVAELLCTLTAAPTADELSSERQAVTTITAQQVVAHSSPPRRRTTVKRRLQLTGAALVGSATLFVGLGAAGALPGAAQGVASDVLATVGVSAPSPDAHAGVHPDTRGRSDDTPSATSTDAGTDASTGASANSAGSNTGATVSGIATDDSTTGIDKGQAVSDAASGGMSQAGDHGAPVTPDTNPAAGATPPVETPNPGGTTTGDTASGGKSDIGTGIADDASGGRADAGSGNADTGLSNKP
jgi:hypothetical protein